ncbi:MAG: hypothetical protein ACRBBW_03805 [Cellvibrionaceae bacterium]
MNLGELLKQTAPEFQIAKVPVSGLGDLEVHQLSLTERFEYTADTQVVIKGDMSEEQFFDRWMWRLLAGRDRKPKKGELDHLKSILTETAEREIYSAAIYFPVENIVKK